MEKAGEFYEKLRQELDDKSQDFYEYESKLDELLTQFGQEVLQESLGKVSENKRKKKTSNAVWKNRD